MNDIAVVPCTVALITGASRGIGQEIALSLSRAGLSVGLLARDEQALTDVRRECQDAGSPGVVTVPADVTDAGSVATATSHVARELGPIDLLVNNAGRIESSEVQLWETDPEEWWRVVETDLRGPFLLCHALLPGMVERGHGRVVNLTTGIAVKDAAIYSAYAAGKTALLRLTGAILAGASEAGVHAFDVAPGTVSTEMTRSMPMHADRSDWTPVSATTDIVDAIAAGRADALSGRYLRAGTDDLESMLVRADELAAADARTLRLRPYGSDDPLR